MKITSKSGSPRLAAREQADFPSMWTCGMAANSGTDTGLIANCSDERASGLF
jgi:hypothetical protein